jgi:hypothetical protein
MSLAPRSELLLAAALLAGCAVTHPRRTEELAALLEKPARIAILEPRVDVRVKYISTEEFMLTRSGSAAFGRELANAYEKVLGAAGHEVFRGDRLAEIAAEERAELEVLNEALLELAEEAIASDPAYSSAWLAAELTAAEIVPPGLAAKVEMIVATKGYAQLETSLGFRMRWIRNVTFNILTLPISIASTFIPFAMPISVTISTSLIEGSPERMFLHMVVIDAKRGTFVYQNDYSSKTVPQKESKFESVVKNLLEEFRAR